MDKKRQRDENDGVVAAAHELQGVLQRDTAHKLLAVERALALVDPADDLYIAQQVLVSHDAAFYLVELLADDAPAVVALAARAVAVLCQHSSLTLSMLQAPGLLARVDKSSLNPLQMDFIDSGALPALVPLLLGQSVLLRDAAHEAVAALTSYNLEGKVAFCAELVQALERGVLEAMQPLEVLLAAMSSPKEDLVSLMDRCVPRALDLLRAPGSPFVEQALTLLSTLCEARPEYERELREHGALRLAVQLLLKGSEEVQDTAAHLVWLLVQSNPQRLLQDSTLGSPQEDTASNDSAGGGEGEGQARSNGGPTGTELLGCHPLELVPTLQKLRNLGAAEDARWEEEAERAGSEEGDTDEQHHAGDTEVCNAGDAGRLLQAMAEIYPSVRAQLASEASLGKHSSCCVM